MDYNLKGFFLFYCMDDEKLRGICSIIRLCFCEAGGRDVDGGWWLDRKLGQYTAGVKAVPAIFVGTCFFSLANHLGLLGLLGRFI